MQIKSFIYTCAKNTLYKYIDMIQTEYQMGLLQQSQDPAISTTQSQTPKKVNKPHFTKE